MEKLQNKVAFITGGASGIGLALAHACGRRGMQVMIGDIDSGGLDSAIRELSDKDIDAAGVLCDVSDFDSVQQAAKRTVETFGKVHLIANNAGVLSVGGAGETPMEEWRRAVDINIMGVVHGVEAFLPLLRDHEDRGYILNTASVGGHVGFAGLAAYSTTKHAVIGYSESIARQLAVEGIGVSVLCPGFVATHIADGEPGLATAVESGMSADVVAEHALQQLVGGEFFIFTHPGTRQEIEDRFQKVSSAFDVCGASDVIMSDPDATRIATKKGVEELC